MQPKPYAAIYAIVRQIPPGRVSSYGRIAALAGLGGNARMVGYALHALAGPLADPANPDAVPWWRVINAQGAISNAYEPARQRALLAHEGVIFDARGLVDFARFLWAGGEDAGDLR